MKTPLISPVFTKNIAPRGNFPLPDGQNRFYEDTNPIILSFWPVNFPVSSGKMSEGQKGGAPPRGLKAYFLQTKFILSGNRFSFSEEETTAFRVRFLLFEHHLFPRTPFIPCGFIIAVTYRTPLVLKGCSLYRYWNLQIIFICGVFLSPSARQAGRKLGSISYRAEWQNDMVFV